MVERSTDRHPELTGPRHGALRFGCVRRLCILMEDHRHLDLVTLLAVKSEGLEFEVPGAGKCETFANVVGCFLGIIVGC